MKRDIWINPVRLADAGKLENVNGVSIRVELSLYGAPKRVEGSYDSQRGVFTVKFGYIDDEPKASRPQRFDNGVEIDEGKFSGKLLAIRIPIDSRPFDKTCVIELKTKVIDALRIRLPRLGGRVDQEMNQQVAERVLEDDLPALVGAC
jgi:hypothetical protein